MTDFNSHQNFEDYKGVGLNTQINENINSRSVRRVNSNDSNISLSKLPNKIQNELISLANKQIINMSSPDVTLVVNSLSPSLNENSATINNTSFVLDENQIESLNFNEILELFGCSISQEQAWAVLNQCLTELEYMMANNQDLLNYNQDSIDIHLLNFTKDGSILFDFKQKPIHDSINRLAIEQTINSNDLIDDDNIASWSSSSSTSSLEEKSNLEAKLLKSVAYLIFDALDYGNSNQNEPDLKNCLQNLLVQMSGHFREYANIKMSEDDEGYEQEEEDSITIEKALDMCRNNVTEAEYHYKAVCRGLYAQAYELKAFLAKIEDSKKILKKSGKDPSNYSFEILNTTDWTKLWMQVIHELRNGVKLRKVSDDPYILRRHIEFELTPFEILLDQIRAKKYHLKKLDPSVMPELKKDARDIILEFIRSRPPLKKSSQRKLKPRNIKLNLHDQLMISIQTYSKPLRKIPEKKKCTFDSESGSVEKTNTKRLLKVDKKLLNTFSSSDDDDSDIDYDELQNSSIFFQSDQYLFQSSYIPNLTDSFSMQSQQKRIKAPDCLKSPLAEWSDPVEDWRALVTEDILSDTNSRLEGRSLNGQKRRHTMNLTDTISNNLASLNIFSSLTNSEKSKMNTERKIKKVANVDISLTFAELCHIRKVLTKNDLDYLLFDKQLFTDVSRGKVCFSCRKSRFNWLNWGSKCNVCEQRICKKCLRNVILNDGQLAQVPLSKLCPRNFSDGLNDNTDTESRHSNSSICSQETNEDSDQLASSTEKLETTSTTSSKTDSIITDHKTMSNESQLPMNICVDCYQLMVSLKVKSSNDECLEPIETEKQSSNSDLVNFLQKKNLTPFLNKQKSSEVTINSPETPVAMGSLEHKIKNLSESPFTKKFTSGHHSTPTPIANPRDSSPDELVSKDVINHSCDQRQILTLNLNPIYSDTP